MSFRERFDCLWCGASHVTREGEDLEGWASLCPRCLGRAGENGFLRARLRTALAERSRAAQARSAEDSDAFYRREGRFARSPIEDAAWSMELDAVTTWIDSLPLGHVVVELGAGGGWWSALLASRAELWAYDPSDASLERVRARLVAHGLLAHLHRRDTDAPADRRVDAVFAAFALGATTSELALERRLVAIRGWLRPGGAFAFVEGRADGADRTFEGPGGALRAFSEDELRTRLEQRGFRLAGVAPGGRTLVAGAAEAVAMDKAGVTDGAVVGTRTP